MISIRRARTRAPFHWCKLTVSELSIYCYDNRHFLTVDQFEILQGVMSGSGFLMMKKGPDYCLGYDEDNHFNRRSSRSEKRSHEYLLSRARLRDNLFLVFCIFFDWDGRDGKRKSWDATKKKKVNKWLWSIPPNWSIPGLIPAGALTYTSITTRVPAAYFSFSTFNFRFTFPCMLFSRLKSD